MQSESEVPGVKISTYEFWKWHSSAHNNIIQMAFCTEKDF